MSASIILAQAHVRSIRYDLGRRLPDHSERHAEIDRVKSEFTRYLGRRYGLAKLIWAATNGLAMLRPLLPAAVTRLESLGGHWWWSRR